MNAGSAILVVALLLLAGCAGKNSTGDQGGLSTGKTEQTILTPGESAGASQGSDGGAAQAAVGNGEIRGTVKDDGGLVIKDALVSRLGSEESTSTNATGSFRFVNVTAGNHVLRVTAGSAFRVHEAKVTVVANRVTLVTITLVPADGRGPGYRPHLHDYWGDATELELMDAPIEWANAPGCTSNYAQYGAAGELLTGVYQANNVNWWRCFGIPDNGQRPPLVLPGTGQLRFSVTWGDDVDVDRFIFGYHAANMAGANFETLRAVGQGEEVTLDVDPESTDNGHQIFSLWVFRIRPEARTVPMTILGPLNVKIIMVKGELPVDPAHEDFWGTNTSLVVRSWDPPHAGATICCTDFHHKIGVNAKTLVPPGTASLAVRLQVVSNRAPGTPHDFNWDLSIKPANLEPTTPFEEYRPIEPASVVDGVKTYVIPVTSSETDAFYQKSSNWLFGLRPNPDLPEALQEYEHRINLEVIANKDPAYV